MEPAEISMESYLETCRRLWAKGFCLVGRFGEMRFEKNGVTYDLSAADLTQLDRIERERLFAVEAC